MKLFAVLLASAILLAACSSVSTHRNGHVDLSRLKRFYVEHRLTDDHHIDEQIVAGLQALGRQASAGPMTMMPDGVEAVVTYEDNWAWDFKSYLIQLSIDIRKANTDQPLARGTYRQPSMITKQPPDVIRAILTPLFKHS